MKNIACALLKVDGTFKKILLPSEMALDLIKTLREKGSQYVRFPNEEILCEGVLILSKDAKHTIMALPSIKGDVE